MVFDAQKHKTVDIEKKMEKKKQLQKDARQEQRTWQQQQAAKKTWKQLSKQAQNACQQNSTVWYISLVLISVLFFRSFAKFQHDKDFCDNLDCIRMYASQMCIILKRKYI